MVPRRRALAKVTPLPSVANSHAMTALALARPPVVRAETIQSTARPSVCSLALPVPAPQVRPRPYVVSG